MSDADTAGRIAEPSLDLAIPPPARGGGYRVLARKYRPASFDDLIGQDAMVRTISNAFDAGRIPQAWILTGVRGVGKTTTARILARGLNYQLPDGSIKAPTVRMPQLGIHCGAIMESRHVDVLEMDAASHNGVDDIRQINDAVRYGPVDARYKVYILDEVHMLTNQAFNALLKTLEEPPPHAKFVFATTEIRQVPITVLSRCQRFDLRRVEADRLVGHLEGILAKESVAAEAEALALIARAAEGSVRDALSLIDQAISHAGGAGGAGGAVRADDVRAMLGLADRGRIVDLFAALMRGDVAGALGELRDQYNSGADPLVTLTELAEFTHFVTRVKVVPAVAEDRSLAEMERKRGRDFAASLSMPMLSRTWQMLFKGLAEIKDAPRPIAAAEMVLVRIAYAANLPSPEEVVRSLEASQPAQRPQSPQPPQPPQPPRESADAPGPGPAGGMATGAVPPVPPSRSETTRAARPVPAAAPPSPAALAPAAIREMPDPVVRGAAPQAAVPVPIFARFADLIAFAGDKRDLQLKTALERDVRLVHFEDGKLEIALEPSASKNFMGDLARRLSALTGRRWMVAVSAAAGEPTVKAQIAARQEEFRRDMQADPLVRHVLARFPGAEIVAVRRPEALSVMGRPDRADGADATELAPDPPVHDDGPGFAADGPDDGRLDDDDVGY